ncbi:MAG TPA: immunoglobulin domain-containing protein [Opitutaceae bacterium]|nr:immunoglobulin domain-containing protein [Opitutaceae bacterium]
MTLSVSAFSRLSRRRLPAALLLTLLQRTPAVRLFVAASDYVVTSPLGQLLRGGLTAAVLGAMHSRAGATTFVQAPMNPVQGTVGTQMAVVFTYNGTPSSPASFQVTGGSLPPGLNFIPAPLNGTIRSGTPAIAGVPTQAGSYVVMVQGFNAEGLTNNVSQEIFFQIEGGVANAAPTISAQPQDQSATVGGSVTFSVAATGQPAPTYQWRKNSTNILGATSASLSLANVTVADAGTYSVVITNSSGSITSAAVALTVNPPAGNLAFVTQPASQTIAAGNTVVFNATTTGATAFQWRRNNLSIAGATGPTLVINNTTSADVGSYTVIASGAGGATVTSSPATLAVVNEPNFGRLINLSILTSIPSAGGDFTMGYVVGGAGTSGPKPLVIRAAGPSLGALGVPGTLADPKLELFAGSTKSGENDNWGGSAQLALALSNVGAFPYTAPTSLDAAMVASITTRDNSVKVSAANSGTGTVIAEIYDATPAGTFTASTPRLINVSVSKQIATGTTLTAGFVIGGLTSRTVLVRAVGPGLAAFGVPGTLADPQLSLFASGKIAENDNWGGDAALSATFTQVGAFVLPPASKDAVLLITLAPGNYSATVTGLGAGGTALVEVYELP